MVVAKWRDRRDVFMLSTKHNLDIVEAGKKNRKNEEVVKPAIILEYNAQKEELTFQINCLLTLHL